MKKLVLRISIIVFLVALVLIYFFFFRSCTVVFDTQGATPYNAVEVRINNKVAKPKVPTLNGYEFLGWYLDNQEYDFNTKVTKNITLVAKWKENS